jgi:glycine betaine/proline transport system substrate-binding protein
LTSVYGGRVTPVESNRTTKAKEGRMRNLRRRSLRVVVAALAVGVVAVLGASANAIAGGKAKCGTVTLDENAWAGATANVYVIKYVLENDLGCKVNIAKLPESTPLFQAMADGKVDAVTEDWGNTKLKVNQNFFKGPNKSLVDLGTNGVLGHIGWFIPTYLMKQHPELKSWTGLKKDWALFKTVDSQGQGLFLGGDPTYVQKDQQLIKELGLNLYFLSVGSEPAQVTRWTTYYKQKKPILFYWYTPQYLNKAYQLSEVKLPPRGKNCVDSYSPKLGSDWSIYRCAYGQQIIDKAMTLKFAKSGSPAVAVVKRWKWTADDQNFVANLIAGKHVDPNKAAEQWVKANPAKVNQWLGK